ncbi:MAG: valine--tRNA ligase [Flavobacteriaceae bacterium]|nr:valine--tRNA ligase [Flavobacteriaceae bacterium]
MKIPLKFNSKEIEDKWYLYWLKNKYFKSTPDNREPYTIVIPPPNVTGVLHMGHMLNNSIQDILIRRSRMKGFNACWVPGTDHASIATEAKVVEKLKEEGIEKKDLTREEFLKHAWDWTNEYGGIILEQLKKIGSSCDWDRTKFTLDKQMYESVIKVFIKLFEKGFIYRGYRMVNWDPEAKTTLSDEEVVYEERKGKLYYIAYSIKNSKSKIIVATTRPETILGDTAICVNPRDERYRDFIGKKAIVPISKRLIPIIADSYVDSEFGTGCLKVTPAHDFNDKLIGEKHNLEFIDIFNSDASMNENGMIYNGLDRFDARKKICIDLKKNGSLIKSELYKHNVGLSERTNSVIEPRLSDQWFLKMEEIVKPAKEAVLKSNSILLVPSKFKSTYRHWMDNIRDWNISRQLWWGHRIPAYYFGKDKDDFVVAENISIALNKARLKSGNNKLNENDLIQDPDVLDTWFSSWLWPISVFDGIRNPKNEDINYYYPTQDLVTGPDILFFWVARMIISGYEFKGNKPFSNVYFTGLVRDIKGRKMSKQLGNSPDALKLISDYGADSVRVGLMLSSAAGNDLLFDENLCRQGKNFANKIWNSYRLISSWKSSKEVLLSELENQGIRWYENKFQMTLEKIEDQFSKYRISEALMSVYKLIWDDFCSWFLELVKPDYNKPVSLKLVEKVKVVFELNLKLLHPFMPFISEEIWQRISTRNQDEALCISKWPEIRKYDKKFLESFQLAKQIITSIRNIRKENNLGFKEKLILQINNKNNKILQFSESIVKLGGLEKIELNIDKTLNGSFFRIKSLEFFIPLKISLDSISEMKKIEDELIYAKRFLRSVQEKLSNSKFVQNAPKKIIDIENKKAIDTEEKIKILRKSLKKFI